jgi:hypothetical protein
METRLLKGLFLLVAVLLVGCAHSVEFKSPDTYQYVATVPLKAVFYTEKNVKDKTWSGRAVSSGVANRWDVPIGRVVQQYANVYLKAGFKEFVETETVPEKPIQDILIRAVNMNYYMANQAAHCDLDFVIESSSGKQVLSKSYHADGPSGFGRVIAGGVFAQKSAIRQSTHVALEIIFKNLMADIQTNYRNWQE